MKPKSILILLSVEQDLTIFKDRLGQFLSCVHAEVHLLVKAERLPPIVQYALGNHSFDELQTAYNDRAESMMDVFEKELSHGEWSLISDIISSDAGEEQVLQFIAEKQIDFVILPGSYDKKHHRLGRDDKHFIRVCPVPVWLIQCHNSQSNPKVLGAVDVPVHHNKPESLNHDIVKMTLQLGDIYGVEGDLINVYPNIPEDLLSQEKNEKMEDYVQRIREHQRDPLNDLADHYNLAHHQVHFEQGDPDFEISVHLEKHDYGILVLGTVGRQGLDKLLYGSVAEKLIDHVRCDIVALKPSI